MSAKDKRIERGQRFRRFRRGENRSRGVSPVVATLILILIAVAAAAALYLWLVVWQGSVTSNVGNPTPQYTVTIGGSTSVYPFDQFAVTQFEQNNSDVAVSNNEGGSGAGMLAFCAGQVDVGTASAEESLTTLQETIAAGGYGCPQTPVPTETTVAYDAVDVIVPVANPHGLVNISYDTLLTIYIANGGGYSAFTAASSLPSTYTFPQASGVSLSTFVTTGMVWAQVPGCAAGPAAGFTCGGATTVDKPVTAEAASAANIATGAACGTSGDLWCYATASTPCGWTVCAGGTTAYPSADTIQQWARADSSGTEQSFTARILGIGDTAGTTAGLLYTGCSPDGQLASCGINPPSSQLGTGNPAVIAGVAGHGDAIGFASDGLARATGSGVSCSTTASPCIGLEAVGQSSAIVPTTGSSGTIAYGILSTSGKPQYQGWRPFEYWTLGAPSGEVARFINFVEDPANNQAFANEAAEVSIYSI